MVCFPQQSGWNMHLSLNNLTARWLHALTGQVRLEACSDTEHITPLQRVKQEVIPPSEKGKEMLGEEKNNDVSYTHLLRVISNSFSSMKPFLIIQSFLKFSLLSQESHQLNISYQVAFACFFCFWIVNLLLIQLHMLRFSKQCAYKYFLRD